LKKHHKSSSFQAHPIVAVMHRLIGWIGAADQATECIILVGGDAPSLIGSQFKVVKLPSFILAKKSTFQDCPPHKPPMGRQ
jgi:hypothetical protein